MGMEGYIQDLPVLMNLLNKYIAESVNNGKFRKIPGKEHTGVEFMPKHQKDAKDKKNMNRKGGYHCFHFINKYHWEE